MEEEDPDPRYTTPKRRPVFRRDRHLQSALHNGEIRYMLENWDNHAGLKKEHISLKRDIRQATILPSDQYIHWALLYISKHGTKGTDGTLSKHIQVANDATDLGSRDYCGVSYPGIPSAAPPLLLQTYHLKRRLARIADSITFSEQHMAGYNFFGCKAKCYGNLHLVWPSDTCAYVITHSHFLAVKDCINSWFSVLAYGHINARKYPGYNLYNEIANVIYSSLHDLSVYKDSAYDILKTWQPLVISTVLKDMEGNPAFYGSLSETISKYPDSYLIRIATRKMANPMDVHMGLELTGMTKCFGHPEIVMDSSVEAWVKKGSVLKPGLERVAEEIRRAFVLEFSRNYYKQKRKWPNLEFRDGHDPYIRQCYDGGYWGEKPDEPWSVDMFSGVRFKKTLEFDYQVYTADLLADKAIIPGLDHWPHEYDGQAHRTAYGRFPTKPPRESNNVIMQYLSREEVNVREIIKIVSTGAVPQNWKVTVAVAKEREMKKLNARFYGKLTLEMRLFQVATENNIKHVFKYIPHQTMTKSEDDLFKHLLKISEMSASDEGGYVFMAMDFSSWCTSFRWEGVTPLFEELDRLLGVTNVIAYTQRFPIESVLLFQDRFRPPEQGPDGHPLNGPRCFVGPEAWQEGLRQKGWTLETLLLILLASWKCGTVATLTGQGDNQVICLRLPGQRTLEALRMTRDQYITWYQDTLSALCTEAGITLKLEETWVSASLLEYGREYFYKGAQVSSAIKRASRMSSEANQTIPSFNGDIAGIFSAGMGAAQKDHMPIPMYWCTILEASIRAHDRFPILHKYPAEYIVALLSVPRVLGGWPITLFPNFCTRSVQDPLTCALHVVRTLMESPRHRDHALRVATTLSRPTNPKMLIKDPQSLPLVMPRQPENYLKNKIAEGLPALVRNKELKPLFSPEMEIHKEELIHDLMNIRPINPKLMSKVMTLSNVGKQEALISKFSSTRSIQTVACREWSSEIEVLKDIDAMEETTMDHMLGRQPDQRLTTITRDTCLTQFAQRVREVTWGIPLEGVTMPAQQEQTQLTVWANVPLDAYERAISLSCEGEATLLWSLDRGPVQPYIGAPTRVRAKRQPLQEMESYSFTQSLSQALQLRSWVKGDEGLTQLLDTIIQEKTDASREDLDRRTSHVYSGSLTHRLPCPTMSRGGQSNSTSNFSSHVRISSSTATAYAKKGEDYTICFQSVFLYGITCLNILYHKYGSVPPYMALVVSRGCCTWTIPPETFCLSHSAYRGVKIPSAILHVEPKVDTGLPYNPGQVDLTTSYSSHMAYKFAIWILNRRDSSRISALERRAVDDVTTPPFVNLSEMCRVSVSCLLDQLVCYLVLLDNRIGRNPSQILLELKDSSTRTGFDDLIDTILLSGLTHSFCLTTHSSPIDLQDREGWRMAISDHIAATLEQGALPLVNSVTVLIPEEQRHIFTRWYRSMAHHLRRRVDPAIIQEMRSGPMRDLLNRAARRNPNLVLRWPPIAMSEEESVAGIRKTPRPGHHPLRELMMPQTPCPDEIRREDASPDIYEMMCCVAGGSRVNQAFEIMVHLRDLLTARDTPIHLYTVDDENGAVYSLIGHMAKGLVVSGFPTWTGSPQSRQAALETGPSCVTGDPCTIRYDHGGFLANLSGRETIRRRAAKDAVEIWVVLGSQERVPLDSQDYILSSTPMQPPEPWRKRAVLVFQPVAPDSRPLWTLWEAAPASTGPPEIITIGLGNSPPETALARPLECAVQARILGTPCFSVLTPVHHLIQGNPSTRSGLLMLVRRAVQGCVIMFPQLLGTAEEHGYMEPLLDRDDHIRRGVGDRLAALGLINGLLACSDVRRASRPRSYIKMHIHYKDLVPTNVCQLRCGPTGDRKHAYTRKYSGHLRKWWKPCILMVASLEGDARLGRWDLRAHINMEE